MRLRADVTIDAPPANVWRMVSDPQGQLRFWSGLTRYQPTGRRLTGVGARYRVLMRLGSADVGTLIEIVEWQPRAELAWTSISGVDMRGRFRLRSRAEGRNTHVELRLSYGIAGTGLGGWLAEQVAAPTVRRYLRETLAELARQVEHEQTRATAAARRSTLTARRVS
ncbi:MAG: SRPBCC family protein [Solirubrobacteraceae bacterium]|nr:SRPBCC family protein [Solirubrobacteraceae bacterium]